MDEAQACRKKVEGKAFEKDGKRVMEEWNCQQVVAIKID